MSTIQDITAAVDDLLVQLGEIESMAHMPTDGAATAADIAVEATRATAAEAALSTRVATLENSLTPAVVVRNTAALWTSGNTVLTAGVIGIETDTGKFKVGDGVTHWPSLAYVPGYIASATVVNAMLANEAQATVKGRASGAGTGAPTDLSGTQVTALLDTFGALKGAVPASPGGSATFLRADGTWANPTTGTTTTGITQRMIIPAYFDPTSHASDWSALDAASVANGGSVAMAICNPASGPGYGSSYVSSGSAYVKYTSQIAANLAAGISSLGYVTLNYRDNVAADGTVQKEKDWATGNVNTASDTITITDHGFASGAGPFYVLAGSSLGGAGTGALPGGLAESTNYYTRAVDANTLSLYDTSAHAIAGGGTGLVDITSVGSGTNSLGHSKTLANIQNVYNEIDLWFSRYPSLNGIFFDEMPTQAGTDASLSNTLTYLADLYTYVKTFYPAKGIGGTPGIVAMNPGSDGATEAMIGSVDVVCSFEGTSTSYLDFSPQAWEASYPATKFCHLVYNCPDQATMQACVDHSRALFSGHGVGYLYVSDTSVWSGPLSSFFNAESAALLSGTITTTKAAGGYYVSTAASTALTTSTPAKAAGTTAAFALSSFAMPANNRLQYTGSDTANFLVSFNGSLSKASGSDSVISVMLYKNGAALTGASVDQSIASTDVLIKPVAMTFICNLATNDYLELWLENNTNGDDAEIQTGIMTVTKL